MDALSEALKVVQHSGAVFFNAEFSSPWCVAAPPSREVAPLLARGADHLVIYHLLTEGRAFIKLPRGELVPLTAGDIVVFPHGDPHAMGNGPGPNPAQSVAPLAIDPSRRMAVSRHGGGGEITRFICGYMACQLQLSRSLLSGLPPLLKVNIRGDASGSWLESSIRYALSAAESDDPGGSAILAKLSEALFVETLRRYMARLPDDQTGWLAGARDPMVGKSLAILHGRPAHPWTIAELSREVGLSRSALAERFTHYLGEPPIAYLTRWRLQLGAQALGSTSRGVAQIAAEVGYESEAAFNRAFKREFGAPPARYRRGKRVGMGQA